MTLELNIFHLNSKHKLVENENQGTDEVCSVDQNAGKSINYKNWLTKMKQLFGSCHQAPLQRNWSAQNHLMRRRKSAMGDQTSRH